MNTTIQAGRKVKAFLSHATVDQDRFVRGLAERLNAHGVDTWYAEWALADGDSLTNLIFEQGIGGADIFIVVLSQNSIGSNWVQAELDVGLVRRIAGKCRLIPIILDGVDVPVALQATLQRRIADINDYDSDFDGLLRSIFEQSSAPPVGSPPAYVGTPKIHGLTAADAAVVEVLGELAIELGQTFVSGEDLEERCRTRDISNDALLEALHAIDHSGLLREARAHGGRVLLVHMRLRLVREYVARHRPDAPDRQRRLVSEIVRRDGGSLAELAPLVGLAPIEAEALLERYDTRGLLKINRYMGGQVTVGQVSPLLKRELT